MRRRRLKLGFKTEQIFFSGTVSMNKTFHFHRKFLQRSNLRLWYIYRNGCLEALVVAQKVINDRFFSWGTIDAQWWSGWFAFLSMICLINMVQSDDNSPFSFFKILMHFGAMMACIMYHHCIMSGLEIILSHDLRLL